MNKIDAELFQSIVWIQEQNLGEFNFASLGLDGFEYLMVLNP